MHAIFSSRSFTPSSSSKDVLNALAIEYGFNWAFMSLFGQNKAKDRLNSAKKISAKSWNETDADDCQYQTPYDE
ncbi:hypothetical protein Tco_0750178 [Tanacetum coccineum]|uniref:Uncharacterized protein n=1 Tax=Tanacetum coccineum TaxID=301880 RepID=A0ABQ4Z3N2_9ASTR